MCAQEAEGAEVPLRGGRVTPGVVRVGDTVRRPATDASPFVADLLHLYERRGFAGAPRHLGVDDSGRDVFSYLPGDGPPRFRHWDDAQAPGPSSRFCPSASRCCSPRRA